MLTTDIIQGYQKVHQEKMKMYIVLSEAYCLKIILLLLTMDNQGMRPHQQGFRKGRSNLISFQMTSLVDEGKAVDFLCLQAFLWIANKSNIVQCKYHLIQWCKFLSTVHCTRLFQFQHRNEVAWLSFLILRRFKQLAQLG